MSAMWVYFKEMGKRIKARFTKSLAYEVPVLDLNALGEAAFLAYVSTCKAKHPKWSELSMMQKVPWAKAAAAVLLNA